MLILAVPVSAVKVWVLTFPSIPYNVKSVSYIAPTSYTPYGLCSLKKLTRSPSVSRYGLRYAELRPLPDASGVPGEHGYAMHHGQGRVPRASLLPRPGGPAVLGSSARCFHSVYGVLAGCATPVAGVVQLAYIILVCRSWKAWISGLLQAPRTIS